MKKRDLSWLKGSREDKKWFVMLQFDEKGQEK